MTPVLAFDIETAPDCDGLRRLYDLDPGLTDKDVAEIAFQRRRTAANHDFLQLHQHRVIAIACALREGDGFRVWSLGTPEDSEAELIRRFFDGIEKYTPQLVSWNGGGFDLPVLHYRSLLHSVTAARYWEMGDSDHSFRFSNYLSRFHWRHMDLMDILSGFQGRGRASLDDIATLLGFPGKVGMHGADVWPAYLQGGLARIRDYCETDVLNTYLIYLRFELLRGHLNAAEHAHEVARVRKMLSESTAEHLREFSAAWPAT